MNTQNQIVNRNRRLNLRTLGRVCVVGGLLLTIGATQVKPAVAGIRPGAARTFETAGGVKVKP